MKLTYLEHVPDRSRMSMSNENVLAILKEFMASKKPAANVEWKGHYKSEKTAYGVFHRAIICSEYKHACKVITLKGKLYLINTNVKSSS